MLSESMPREEHKFKQNKFTLYTDGLNVQTFIKKYLMPGILIESIM